MSDNPREAPPEVVLADSRTRRLLELKIAIDAVHEVILRALRGADDAAIDRAMEQQHALMQEYHALLRDRDDGVNS